MVFTFYNDPSTQKHYLSYDAALILVVIVLLLLVASRVVVARTQRHSESARGAYTGPRGGRKGPGRRRRRTRTSKCRSSKGRLATTRTDLLRWARTHTTQEADR